MRIIKTFHYLGYIIDITKRPEGLVYGEVKKKVSDRELVNLFYVKGSQLVYPHIEFQIDQNLGRYMDTIISKVLYGEEILV